MLAERAEVSGGKLYVMGGAFDHALVPALPASLQFSVALVIEMPWLATNQQYRVRISFQTADGLELAALEWQLIAGRPPMLSQGDIQLIPVAFPMVGLTVAQPGLYVVIATLDNVENARTRFRVTQIQPGVVGLAGQ
jgi:hypothetical protein